MLYFKDFKLYKYESDTGYIVLFINGSEDVVGYLNDIELLYEQNGFNSSALFIDVSILKEGKNKIIIIDNINCETTELYLEVVINDKNSIC